MTADNPYDQFDSSGGGGNPYDQFTQEAPVQTKQSSEGTANEDNQGFLPAMARGFKSRGIGMGQLLNDIGVGQHIGLPPNEAYSDYAAKLEKEGQGTGVTGAVGEMAGDPLSYVPIGGPSGAGAKALLKTAGKFGALGGASSLAAPTGDDRGLLDRAANSAAGAGLSSVVGPAAGFLAKGTGKIGQWAANKTGLSDAIDRALSKFGKSSSGGDLYQLAQQVGLPTEGKTGEEIYNAMQDWRAKNVQDAAAGISSGSYTPVGGNSSISENYYNDLQNANDLYSGARFHGEGKTVVANGLQNQLNQAIDSLGGKQFRSPSEEATLGRLQDIQNNLGKAPKPYNVAMETGSTSPTTSFSQARANVPPTAKVQPLDEIGYNDLLDLKQAMNEGYNPSRFAKKGDRPMARLFKNVQDSLAKAGEQDPEFGQALHNADTFWGDEIAPTYHNDTIKKFWTPDDYHEHLQSHGFTTQEPTADLQNRAGNTLNNIKTPADLQAVAAAMPRDQANDLMAAKFKQIMDDSGLNAEKISDNYDLLKRITKNPVVDNIKAVSDELNKRGIGDSAKFYDQDDNGRLTNGISSLMNAYYNRPVSAFKDLARFVGKDAVTGVSKRLVDFQKAIGSGKPSQNVLKAPIEAAGAQTAKQTAIGTGDEEQYRDIPHITIHPSDMPQINVPTMDQPPPYADGGAVSYSPVEWSALVRKHGKSNGIKMSDRLTPSKVEKMDEAVKNHKPPKTKYRG